MIDEPIRPARLALYDRPYILLALAALFWSGNFVLGRAVSEAVPPVALAFYRWFGGALLIMPFALAHTRRDWPVIRRHWKIVLLLSFFGVAVFNTLVYTGLGRTTAINGLLMQSTQPVIIIAFTFLLFRETVRPIQIVAVALSLLGVLTIILRGDPQTISTIGLNVGDVIIFLAVISYAAYTALLRRRPPIHPFSFLLVTFGAGAVMLLPLYIAESLGGRPLEITSVALGSIAYVCIFPSILAYLCYNRGVELVGANRAGHFFHLMPVFGSLLAILFLGERFQAYHAFGIALIVAGIVLAARRDH
jgi:drug/metabolite transporter (DMT)-like permease